MIVSNIKDPKGFFNVLKDCKGKVELVTDEGDRLNLKSTLSQYIIMSNIFLKPEIAKAELLFSNEEDIAKVVRYITYK